jgi:hypothetical protein
MEVSPLAGRRDGRVQPFDQGENRLGCAPWIAHVCVKHEVGVERFLVVLDDIRRGVGRGSRRMTRATSPISSTRTGMPRLRSSAAAARASTDVPLPGKPVIHIAQLMPAL